MLVKNSVKKFKIEIDLRLEKARKDCQKCIFKKLCLRQKINEGTVLIRANITILISNMEK